MVTQAANPSTKRLQCLLRHIENVREDCELLGIRLIERGEFEFGKTLIQHGLIHDNSKFEGVEWEELNGLHDGDLGEAIKIHVHKNPHHPEYWDLLEPGILRHGIHLMPRIYVAEMICDWHARSTEFGSALRPWIDDRATAKYHFSKNDQVYKHITDFLSLLLENPF